MPPSPHLFHLHFFPTILFFFSFHYLPLLTGAVGSVCQLVTHCGIPTSVCVTLESSFSSPTPSWPSAVVSSSLSFPTSTPLMWWVGPDDTVTALHTGWYLGSHVPFRLMFELYISLFTETHFRPNLGLRYQVVSNKFFLRASPVCSMRVGNILIDFL